MNIRSIPMVLLCTASFNCEAALSRYGNQHHDALTCGTQEQSCMLTCNDENFEGCDLWLNYGGSNWAHTTYLKTCSALTNLGSPITVMCGKTNINCSNDNGDNWAHLDNWPVITCMA